MARVNLGQVQCQRCQLQNEAGQAFEELIIEVEPAAGWVMDIKWFKLTSKKVSLGITHSRKLYTLSLMCG